MGRPKALGSAVLPEEEVRADRKKAKRYDLWAVGEKALYVGTNWTPRKYYIPYSSIRRVFKRVAVSPGSGKAFLTPILYLVVQYDDGKEHQSTFKYLQDADNLLNQLEKEHPEISLLSPEGEAKKKERQEQERRAAANELSVTAQKAKHRLETAQRTLEKQPALTRALAQSARMKRTLDLIDPKMQAIAIAVAAAGLIAIAAGLILIPLHGNTNVVILMILAGFAAVFMMINSRVLPTRRRNKKALQRDYDKAVSNLQDYIGKQEDFPLPARYSHPFVAKRMIRILQTQRADNMEGALTVLKEDLRAADCSVALSGDDYTEVVTIKPLFTVADYA